MWSRAFCLSVLLLAVGMEKLGRKISGLPTSCASGATCCFFFFFFFLVSMSKNSIWTSSISPIVELVLCGVGKRLCSCDCDSAPCIVRQSNKAVPSRGDLTCLSSSDCSFGGNRVSSSLKVPVGVYVRPGRRQVTAPIFQSVIGAWSPGTIRFSLQSSFRVPMDRSCGFEGRSEV